KVLEAMKTGASDFVVKPFQKEQILDAITRLL
ncbi:response regulator, partial [Mesorhizobium sp. M00.F.Ca.ET.186.01.1.1]